MTSAQIRQSFFDFFREKQHAIVPSSSLLPDAPNLLFTNAGMNRFVPVFLGEQKPAWDPPRVADTQKCVRAGGKHNDLDDVGLDTYHHTFFEMLGNWSFGDYFKKEAIEWAWELVVERWKLPPQRLYATVYQPGPGEPSGLDQEAHDHWARLFEKAGLDPAVQIVNGSKKDNFWMMGDTGPCGPCSELHIDLTPAGDTKGSLVNAGDPRCIEIWNLVFVQFNANADGTFVPLPARHVDTGMGFERVAAMIQGTKNFTDFSRLISNYETDVFRPIFDEIQKLSGKRYGSTLPRSEGVRFQSASTGLLPASESSARDATNGGLEACAPGKEEQEKIDVAFRVIADHIRTLSFAIADGIQPSNEGRGYVLRRILRRAVRYGRTLGFHGPFFFKLVDVLARTMSDVFPELRANQKHIQETLKREEEAFNKTLNRGIEVFERCLGLALWNELLPRFDDNAISLQVRWNEGSKWHKKAGTSEVVFDLETDGLIRAKELGIQLPQISAEAAFELYDTYGFPLDLTELMARERGLSVDAAGFEKHMEEQRARARATQKKQIVRLSETNTKHGTWFCGYDKLCDGGRVVDVVYLKDKTAVVLDQTVCFAEMGGQVGDTGRLVATSGWSGDAGEFVPRAVWRINDTQKVDNSWLHIVEGNDAPPDYRELLDVRVDVDRRRAIERHHTVTHLLHWALHEVVSRAAAQKGSYVGPEKLTFDFNSAALTSQQVQDVERLVNERIVENVSVSWTEMPYAEAKARSDIMQFFGDKYGDTVRVVQIGGEPRTLNGYSMELCGGTHVRGTGEIGLFRILSETAIAAGVRRVEAVAGLNAYASAKHDKEFIRSIAGKLNSPIADLEKRIDSMLAQQKTLEKTIKALEQKQAGETARQLLGKALQIGPAQAIIENVGSVSGDQLQAVADGLKQQQFQGVIVLAGSAEGSVALLAAVTPQMTSKFHAGKIIQAIAPIVGGKGGGRPDSARGAGKDVSKIEDALARARNLVAA